MHVQQQSTRLTLSLIIALTILSAAITTTVITTIKSTRAQLEDFATPAAVTATATAGQSSSSSSSGKEFSARLTGDKEVPPVDTDATGRIRLTANSQQDVLDYQLSVSNLNGVATGAHIHRGSAGTNGPIVANLNIRSTFAGASASASAGGGSAMTSTSTGGTITSADLKGPLAGKQVSDLIKLIEDGKAYVNVHTRQHTNGEIRGQLTSLSSSDTANEDDTGSSLSGASATASTSPSASASATAP
ncbi:MAG: CHRD domain-containing protein [Nitrososphaeraceae archaeon]